MRPRPRVTNRTPQTRFVSYRVTTEGEMGNGMSGLVAEKIRTLSMDTSLQLQIPRQGWGIWPKRAKQPVPTLNPELSTLSPNP